MTPEYLAKLALSRLPKPYTDEVILHVFCEIERTPHLRGAYDGLMVGENGYTHVGLNREISYLVRTTLNAQNSQERIPAKEDVCEIVKSVTRLDDFDSNWSWSDEE